MPFTRSFAAALLTSIAALGAPPPAASVIVPLTVPASMRSGPFTADRTLRVPPGFRVEVLARVPDARFLAVAPNGDVFVSRPGAGRVVIVRPVPGGDPQTFDYVTGLRSPHDMVFDTIDGTTYLYVSETNQINRFVYRTGDTKAGTRQIVVTGLPDASTPELRGAYGHQLKNIALGPDHKLYVSIGSTCNACTEDTVSNPIRASIYQYNADGTGGRLFARGLRNAEGLAFVPGTNNLWVVVNNRDNLAYPRQDGKLAYGQITPAFVDDHPPELFTAVKDQGNYGWPFCFSNPDTSGGYASMPFERDYEFNRNGQVNCDQLDRPSRGIQAHSAPLGVSFLQGTRMPAAYRNGAVSALHGSWNRTEPTGYKVIYFPWDSARQTAGEPIDLVSGWLDAQGTSYFGRPVDVVPDQDGNLLISDDASGTIYRLRYQPAAVLAPSANAVLAPGALASAFGTGFASSTVAALDPAWPMTLGGVGVTLRDSTGTERPAALSYISATQVNFVVPSETAPGTATIILTNGTGRRELGTLTVSPMAPGVFTANGTGEGVAAATAQVVSAEGTARTVPVFSCAGAGSCTATPIDVVGTGTTVLTLYATGLRNRADGTQVTVGGNAARVLYAGPQPTYPGLDQVNVELSASLAGTGEVDLLVTVDGQTANTVRINVQ